MLGRGFHNRSQWKISRTFWSCVVDTRKWDSSGHQRAKYVSVYHWESLSQLRNAGRQDRSSREATSGQTDIQEERPHRKVSGNLPNSLVYIRISKCATI